MNMPPGALGGGDRDSPDCSWFASRCDTNLYRCNVCGEFSVGPDPYCVSFDDEEEESSR